jgi:hypothetical protein
MNFFMYVHEQLTYMKFLGVLYKYMNLFFFHPLQGYVRTAVNTLGRH